MSLFKVFLDIYSLNVNIGCKHENGSQKTALINHCNSRRTDYNTFESRLSSFKLWPSRIHQKPVDLSEAGFYYCGEIFII